MDFQWKMTVPNHLLLLLLLLIPVYWSTDAWERCTNLFHFFHQNKKSNKNSGTHIDI